jgi:predicted RecB family nuclease
MPLVDAISVRLLIRTNAILTVASDFQLVGFPDSLNQFEYRWFVISIMSLLREQILYTCDWPFYASVLVLVQVSSLCVC